MLCEACWANLAPEDRLPYYRRRWEEWLSDEETWRVIRSAVLDGR